MPADDFEDMLFGDLTSHTCLDDTLSDASEDEILFALFEDESTLWDLQNSPQLDKQSSIDNVEFDRARAESCITILGQGRARDR